MITRRQFVSDVTRQDFDWILQVSYYGHLFTGHSDNEMASLKKMAQRWKQYVSEGKWIYEAHPFWCSGYTFWDIKTEAPDLFLHLSESDLVLFKVSIALPLLELEADTTLLYRAT